MCSPYSAHLYTRLLLDDDGTRKEEDGLAMTQEFCDEYVTACRADLDLPATYCEENVLPGGGVEYWSYPLPDDFDGKIWFHQRTDTIIMCVV